MHIRTVAAIAAGAVLAIAPAVMPTSVAHAQVGGLGAFGIAAGASVPSGDFGDSHETGFHASVLLGISPPLLPVGFRAEGSYHQFAGKEGTTLLGIATPDLRLLTLTGNVILTPPGMILARPYLIGGVGLYNSKFDLDNVDADNDFGFNVGIGGKFSLTGFSTFAEIRYHRVSSDGESTSFIPVTFGIMF